ATYLPGFLQGVAMDVTRTAEVTRPRMSTDVNVKTAADLMVPTPLTIQENTSVQDALSFLIDQELSAAPVIDAMGEPVGVVTRSDAQTIARGRFVAKGSWPSRECAAGCVRDFMTPVFFSVRAEMPAARVIREIRALRLHHLFVISGEQQVVGIIDG